jgi:hypothetical protein
MGKVLAFRGADENCANCWYYTPHRNDPTGQAASSTGYCRHPDRAINSCLCHPVIERLGLHCMPDQWCPKYVHVDSTAMKTLQFISGIKFVLLCMQRRVKTYNTEAEKTDEYRELVDQFYLANKKLMTINQYKRAKRDHAYFTALLDETFQYYKQKSRNRKQ